MAKRTGDEEGRIVHGGELPSGSNLDDVVVDAPEAEDSNDKPVKRRIVLKANTQSGMKVEAAANYNIEVYFEVLVREREHANGDTDTEVSQSVVWLKAYSTAKFCLPYRPSSGELQMLEAVKDSSFSEPVYLAKDYLRNLGYRSKTPRGPAAGHSEHHMKFLEDFAEVNSCEIDYSRLVAEATQLNQIINATRGR